MFSCVFALCNVKIRWDESSISNVDCVIRDEFVVLFVLLSFCVCVSCFVFYVLVCLLVAA